ncbi:hypothetical protein [Urinicoccus massiliensis]|uniref:hypothetical protein n=1 Tax=Urinicoccus massiliensis TaxID=1723382 RepID=UPI0009307F32|nr:hypothetical protein [Urinicoccus massiliensis]
MATLFFMLEPKRSQASYLIWDRPGKEIRIFISKEAKSEEMSKDSSESVEWNKPGRERLLGRGIKKTLAR